MESLINRTLANNFLLLEKKPSGQISDVYRAKDNQKGVNVGVKILRKELAANQEYVRLLEDEAIVMNDLQHPNIVRFYSFHRDGELAFIVMDWVEGSNLKEIIQTRQKPFQLREVLEILQPVFSALHFAHGQGVVHCDIKPSNILVSNKKHVILSDFGIAKRTSERTTMGTPPYMAPEQFTGQTLTPRTDIYALGVTCYEMLSGGKVPFRGETSGTDGTTLRDRIYWEVMNLPYPPIQELNPKVPSAVDNVLRQSLQRNPNQRQRSVEEFYQQFSAAADKTVDPLRKPPVNPPIRGAYLVGLEGEWQGESLPITSAQFLLGRCSAANLHFNDSTVSRSHATILAARDGFWIRDENSKGGTFVNRHPVQRMQKLRSGDVIHITGGQCFRFIIQRSGR